ncbi:hypothetical protein EJ08DRAFT_738467 [Tothia fuscella]|uniref:LEM-like domain-containing protein n=1 Tax=Tothia fuscella TaxID=1048955 RepID=A0A9P4NGQ4_9PEZI|nr:hypothetical protein EJ08DRAFT_738467 [Tothia fuscella]
MSHEPDELEYLAPDFEPSTLTVPRLRNILLAHSINYPSSAKKPQLIQLFNEHVAAQAKKILTARAKTKRSTRGIVDVPSSQASTVDDEEEEARPQPPPTTSRTRSSRRVNRHEEEDADATLLAPTPARARRTTSKDARSSEPEPEERPAARKSRKSRTPVAVKAEEEQVSEPWRSLKAQDVDSPFTTDNPFQSGSSPPAEARSNSRRRRSSIGPVKDKRKSASTRRKTDGPKAVKQEDDFQPPSRSTFEMPVARVRRNKKEEQYEDEVPAGEEFTPEETLDFATTDQHENAVVRHRRKHNPISPLIKIAPLSMIGVMLAGCSYLWRQEKLDVGFCGIGKAASGELGGVVIPDWAEVVRPQCEPCPPHAYCHQNLGASCDTDFILKPHPLSLGGLVPLPPTCEPDSEKAQRVVAVANRAIDELRDRNAKFECSEPLEEDGKPPASPAIPEEELKETMSAMRRKKMSQEAFDQLWEGAIGEILQREEIESNIDGANSHRRTLRSTSLAKTSLTCAIRQSIRHALVRYIWPIITLLLLTLTGIYTRYTITYNRITEEKAKKLASFALDRLHTQAALHAADSGAYPEGFLSMGHLRDDVLRDEFSAKRRNKIWERVKGKVEGNMNVRPAVREGRFGDVSRVWEWTGAVAPVGEDIVFGSADRRVSGGGGRYSMGAAGNNSPLTEYSTVPEVKRKGGGGGKEMVETRKWEESRPIY